MAILYNDEGKPITKANPLPVAFEDANISLPPGSVVFPDEMEAQLVDDTGAAFGTAANPLVTQLSGNTIPIDEPIFVQDVGTDVLLARGESAFTVPSGGGSSQLWESSDARPFARIRGLVRGTVPEMEAVVRASYLYADGGVTRLYSLEQRISGVDTNGHFDFPVLTKRMSIEIVNPYASDAPIHRFEVFGTRATLSSVAPEEETRAYARSGELAGGGSQEVLFDLKGQPCLLQALSMGTDYPYAQLRIAFYDRSGVLDGNIQLARRDGLGMRHPTPVHVQEDSGGENDIWRNALYDDDQGEFVLTMKRNVEAINGMRITIHNHGVDACNVAVNAVVSTRRKVS